MRLAIFALGALLSGAAPAQLPGKKPDCMALSSPDQRLECMDKYADCSTPAWLTNAARLQCDAEASQKSSAAARSDRAAIEAKLDPERRKALRKADTAFEAFAKADCEFQASDFTGGSLYSVVYSACQTRWQKERARQDSLLRKALESGVR